MKKEMQVEQWPIEKVLPYKNNAKIHDQKQVSRIAKSIKEFGWRGNPIVVDTAGEIIAGHGRRLAAIELGMKEVPVIVARDLSEEQVKALRLADNRVAMSDYDANLLQQELSEIDFDLEGIFDKKELDFMSADIAEMDSGALAVDLDEEVAMQAQETVEKIKTADESEVKIDKALGFKTIKGKDERIVARFMAQIEEETGATGSEAFVKFISSIF